MKEMLRKLLELFGCKHNDKKTFWVIVFKRKAEFTKDNELPETYVCSAPFGTEYEAMRHEESLKQELTGFDIVDICQVRTDADITVCKYDYTISEEHPRITVEYEEI